MQKLYRAVLPLRILLVLLFAAVLLAQVLLFLVMLPEMLGNMPGLSAELAQVGWTMLTVAVLGLLCVEIVIVCTWKLLTLVKHDRIFSTNSLPWVDAIVWAITGAWAVLLGAFVYLFVFAGVDEGPGLPAVLLLTLLVGAALGLLMVVMRVLLRQATTLRSDMEGVI